MGKIYLTSDLHLNHNSSFGLHKIRGFKNYQEMTEGIIKNFNEIVTDEDTVYILGDICLGPIGDCVGTVSRLNGKKHLIIGNHDTNAKLRKYKELGIFESVEYQKNIFHDGTKIVLTHFPVYYGQGTKGHDGFNAHGHTHAKKNVGVVANTNLYEGAQHIDVIYHVGVDSHDMKPVEIGEMVTEYRLKQEEVRESWEVIKELISTLQG